MDDQAGEPRRSPASEHRVSMSVLSHLHPGAAHAAVSMVPSIPMCACQRGIYDNMKTAVEAVFVGKARLYNRRFLQMCGHYLVEPVAYAGVGLGEGSSREPSGSGARTVLHPKTAVQDLRRDERLAAG
jgi:hypothetical protein